ncbi:MAG: GNAT family N-acetyltransferase [Reyranellaceae bacterium]
MAEFTIEREEDTSGGRYVIHNGAGESEMTYSLAGGTTMVIGHTYVPPALRGKGLAEALVRRGIEDARKQGRKIMPLCSYVRTEFKRHPEWNDVLAG